MATNRRKTLGPKQGEIDEIAKRLRLTREALGLSPAELCRMTGIKPNTYSNWEGGTARVGLGEAKVLRRVLGYSLDWIYEGDRSGLPLKLASAIALYEQQQHAPGNGT
jgi:transcriptional regulator with XRE-family HTH domain